MQTVLNNEVKIKDKLNNDINDVAIGDGLSLEMGSSAYKEYILDRLDIDEDLQEQLSLNKINVEQIVDNKVENGFNLYQNYQKNYSADINMRNIIGYENSFNVRQKNIRQNLKLLYAEDALYHLQKEVKKTPSLDDDKQVQGVIRHNMMENVYDDGKSYEDFEF